MIYVWYYCTERANKMRLVSTKDKLVLFCSADEMLETHSLYGECFLSLWFFFLSSLSRKLRMKLSRLLSCVRIQAMKFQGRVQLRERVRNSERRETAQEKPAVWGGIFQSLTNETQPNHPPKHHLLLWDAHINNDFVLFRPACMCECVKI